MLKKVKLIDGDTVNVRARCSNSRCGLLMVSDIGDQTPSKEETTVHRNDVLNLNDL